MLAVYTASHRWNLIIVNSTHNALLGAGNLVLAVPQSEEKDMLWIVHPDLYPFKQNLVESKVSLI